MQPTEKKDGILLVANWDSNVGFAWWLMESFWSQIAQHFKEGYVCYLAYPSISQIPESIKEAPIHCIQMDFTQNSSVTLLQRIKFIRSNKIKILYLTDQKVSQWKYAFYRIAGVRKIILHDHTPGKRSESKGFKGLIKSFINNSVFSADGLFATSNYVKHRFVNTYRVDPKKCFTVPNGIRFRDIDRDRKILSQFDIKKDQLVIIGTGRAHKIKGIEFALDCLAKIRETYPDLDFVYLYCGDGPHLEIFKSRASFLGMSKIVRFPGRIENIQSVCRASDIAFHPSKGEVGYSLSMLECMMARLPILVPDNPSVCDIITHTVNGLIYEDDNVNSASADLSRLLFDSKLRRRLGERANKDVYETFNLEYTHKMLLNAFENCIEK